MQDKQDDSSLRLKQEEIKTEIIDKHYDTQKFLSYCLTKKDYGDNLVNWTLDELKEIIILFTNDQNGMPITEKKDMMQSAKFQPNINVDIEKLRIMVRINDLLLQ